MPFLFSVGSDHKTNANMDAKVVAILDNPQGAQLPIVCVVSDYSGRQRVEQFGLDGACRDGCHLMENE